MRAPTLLLILTACGTPTDGEDCPEGTTPTTECSGCGPADECLDPIEVCAGACEGDFTPCDDEGGVCLDGLCLHNVCG